MSCKCLGFFYLLKIDLENGPIYLSYLELDFVFLYEYLFGVKFNALYSFKLLLSPSYV